MSAGIFALAISAGTAFPDLHVRYCVFFLSESRIVEAFEYIDSPFYGSPSFRPANGDLPFHWLWVTFCLLDLHTAKHTLFGVLC
jgi:hypothetical protein